MEPPYIPDPKKMINRDKAIAALPKAPKVKKQMKKIFKS
jgi:hypothetical protein